jgi:phage terminase large subunit GpA-like protein
VSLTHALGVAAINDAVRRRFRRHCRPRPKLTLSQWAKQYRIINGQPWRSEVCPEWDDVMDAISDWVTQEITVVAPSQSAKTEIGVNACGFFTHQEPCPQIVVQPNGDMAKSFSRDRLAVMYRSSPELAKLVPPARNRESGNTLLSKQYPGGQIDITTAKSPAGLAMRPKRFVFLDERDRHPRSAGKEGDVKSIVRARTKSYQRRRKIYEVASPTSEEESLIWKSYLEGTQEVREVPCPHCHHFQVLVFERLRWNKSDAGMVLPESVHYVCASCEQHIGYEQRAQMKSRGRWVSTGAARVPFKRSFRLPGLLAAFQLWDEVAQEFETANQQKDLGLRAEMMRAFWNTTMGELYRDQESETVKAALLARALPYDTREAADGIVRWQVPREVGILVAGLDLQHDRGEIVVRGYGVGEESWLIERVVLRGDTSQPTWWAELEQWRTKRTWRHESGATMQIRSLCIDAGDGTHSKQVYSYCAPRWGQCVYAIKGSSNPSAPLTPLKVTRVKPGRLYIIGVNGIMDRVYRRLSMTERGPGYLHMNEHCDEDFAAQLLSMRRVIDPRTRKRKWEATPNVRNEVPDSEGYAYAAFLLGPVPPSAMAAEIDRVNAAGSVEVREAADPTMARVVDDTSSRQRASSSKSFVTGWR